MSTLTFATQRSTGTLAAARRYMGLGHCGSWHFMVNPNPSTSTTVGTIDFTKRSTRHLGVQPT
jgi:hypothetical protein